MRVFKSAVEENEPLERRLVLYRLQRVGMAVIGVAFDLGVVEKGILTLLLDKCTASPRECVYVEQFERLILTNCPWSEFMA